MPEVAAAAELFMGLEVRKGGDIARLPEPGGHVSPISETERAGAVVDAHDGTPSSSSSAPPPPIVGVDRAHAVTRSRLLRKLVLSPIELFRATQFRGRSGEAEAMLESSGALALEAPQEGELRVRRNTGCVICTRFASN